MSALPVPQRPSSSASVRSWRVSDATAALAGSRSLSVRQSLLLAGTAGFLGGYFVFYDQWLQLGWGLLTVTAWLLMGGVQELAGGLRRDRWLTAALGLLFVLMVRSSVLESPGVNMRSLWLGWANSALLAGFLLTLWQAARLPRAMAALGKPLVVLAAVAALVSLVVFYSLHPEGLFGSRLRNWFVFGGWNSVCSGLTFGFAACWAAYGWNTAAEPRERRRWLLALLLLEAATLFTLSRGALLALLTGHTVLLLAQGWRQARKPVLLLLAVLAAFQLSAPLLARLAIQDASKRMGLADTAAAAQVIGDAVVSPNPMQAAMARSDNGRFVIYEAALGTLTGWQDWLFGKGLWADNDCWSCSLRWYPEHLHSLFLDALIRGGLPGLLGLAAVFGWGARRAWQLARRGEGLWIMLAGYGVTGLLFDGDSAFALVSVARYEPLLFWTPLVIASARWQLQAETPA